MTKIIHADEMSNVLYKLFVKHEFSTKKARILAEVYTENTLHGVNSHGINRVPLFIDHLTRGVINKDTEAEKAETFGSIERWDGHLGPGVINAIKCTNRAIDLANENGMGLVALRNTNHWMRGGYYGWMAAESNCISILFTNTEPNMPAWGGKEARLGNNPLVISIPRSQGHIVLDMAMSQFAFGKINEYKLRGEKLPFDGGWDKENNLTRDPEEIIHTKSALPIGYWKGSALSMVLDMLATLLSAGRSTYKIGMENYEKGVSQIFLCISPKNFPDQNLTQNLIDEIIDYTRDSTPLEQGTKVFYPGEQSLARKIENQKNGMEVNEEIWQSILSLSEH